MGEESTTGWTGDDGMLYIISEASEMSNMMGEEYAYDYYPEIFGSLTTNTEGTILTIEPTFNVGSTEYPLLMMFFEDDDWTLYDANTSGRFCITMPPSFGDSGIGSISSSEANGNNVVYYNLQGIRIASPTPGITIERRGSKARKIVR